MKKSNLAIIGTLAAALAFGFALAGCEHGPGPQAPPPDNPTAGNMTSETANAVFGRYGEGWANYGDGVEIKGFLSASALAEYLGVAPLLSVSYSLSVSASVAPLLDVTPSGATLNISSISGRPVVRIGEGAFKPKEGDKDTFINTVVTVIKLPETLRELGKNVFSGVDAEVKIPEAAIEKIVENAKAGTTGQTEADDSAILQELIGKTVTITKIEDDESEEIVVAAAEPPMDIPGAIILEAASPADLNTKIAQAKSAYSEGDEIVINLTTAFYTAATNFIVIDPGTTDNDVPYTIRGLGTGPNAPSLSAAVLLANDNVTLEYVKIAVTTTTKAALTQGIDTPQTEASRKRYTAAVSIGRSSDGTSFLTSADMASKNVTVRNCDITIDYTSGASGDYQFNAGIYICGDQTWMPAPPKNIVITGNTVTAKGYDNRAAQGLSVRDYDPTMVITNNILTSETGGAQTINAPAAGLFMAINPRSVQDSDTPQIAGNILNGRNIDFYVNILNSGSSSTSPDYKGIPVLFNNKFGTYYSTWALGTPADDGSSFYRKFYAELMKQSDGGYAGLFFMVLGTNLYDGYCFTYEAWLKSGASGSAGTVIAVDYWGATILDNGNAAVYNAEGKDTDTKAGGSQINGKGSPAGYRGRLVPGGSGGVTRGQDFQFNAEGMGNTDQGDYLKKPNDA